MARPRRPVATPPRRDWIQISVTALPGVVALIALVFAYLSIRATNDQLQIAEQGQITDRYNAAIANLGSLSIDVRLGGIYALQRIMQDSSRDQPTVVAVLCAFVRDHANMAASAPSASQPSILPLVPSAVSGAPTDIQAALTVVGTRNTVDDGSTTIIDLIGADLNGADLDGANLTGANLTAAHLDGANLDGANLDGANLIGAKLDGTFLAGANFIHAGLYDANLSFANLSGADLTGADLTGADLSNADLTGADLTAADLTGAHVNGATKGLPTGTPPPHPPYPTVTPASVSNLRR